MDLVFSPDACCAVCGSIAAHCPDLTIAASCSRDEASAMMLGLQAIAWWAESIELLRRPPPSKRACGSSDKSLSQVAALRGLDLGAIFLGTKSR